MEPEELIKAKKYFEKAKGIRMGLWMSEVRKQYALRMHREGAKSRHIKSVTFLRHDQTWHYINRCKPNPQVENVVLENMDEWIEKGLYPISVRIVKGNVHLETGYELSEDPSYKSKVSKNIKDEVKTKWDKLVDDLLI